MYQYLYWYSVAIPYGTQTIYRDYDIEAVRITPIMRFGAKNRLSVDVGPEVNFSDGVSIGLLSSVNYNIPISDKIDIPIKLRTDLISGIKVTLPISLNVGVRLKL